VIDALIHIVVSVVMIGFTFMVVMGLGGGFVKMLQSRPARRRRK